MGCCGLGCYSGKRALHNCSRVGSIAIIGSTGGSCSGRQQSGRSSHRGASRSRSRGARRKATSKAPTKDMSKSMSNLGGSRRNIINNSKYASGESPTAMTTSTTRGHRSHRQRGDCNNNKMSLGKSDRNLRNSGSRESNSTKQQQQQKQGEEMDRALAKHMESAAHSYDENDGDDKSNAGAGKNNHKAEAGSHLEFDPTAKNNVAVVATKANASPTTSSTSKFNKQQQKQPQEVSPVAPITEAVAKTNTPKSTFRRATITIKLPIPTWGRKKVHQLDSIDSSSEIS